jgi:hypothetical protein
MPRGVYRRKKKAKSSRVIGGLRAALTKTKQKVERDPVFDRLTFARNLINTIMGKYNGTAD